MRVALRYPDYAYVPGQTPRHPDGWFDDLRATVVSGTSAKELQETPAWNAGLSYLEAGYYWEAHEVLEPVWMALPDGSREKEMVQALIQLANAFLKRKMNRPRAVSRLCALVIAQLDVLGAGKVMGLAVNDLRDRAEKLEAEFRIDSRNNAK